jgi:uncharacterized protein (DUF2141 family)
MRNLIITTFCFALSFTLSAQAFKLTVNLEDLDQERGTVQICLMNDAKQYLKDCYIGRTYRFAADKPRQMVFDSIPPGEYAIMAFHDVDGNGRLNTNGAFGLPSEPYAFSNNPNTWFGPPKQRKCVFNLKGDKTISLEF